MAESAAVGTCTPDDIQNTSGDSFARFWQIFCAMMMLRPHVFQRSGAHIAPNGARYDRFTISQKSSLTDAERARLEALGDEMAADLAADTTPKGKIKGSERQTGTVKWYNSAKGFGFITSQSGPDVFVHRRAIVGGIILQEGQIVDYVESAGQKGPQAEEVQLRTP